MKKRLSIFTILFLLLVSIIPIQTNGQSANISNERILPRLVDGAGLLSQDQADDLLSKLDQVSEGQNFDIAIITVDALEEGYTSIEYADDIYDYNGFGMGEDYDGILFLISMEERDWAISTHGFGILAFTDAGQEYMVDNFIGHLSDGDYYKGFDKFVDLSDDFISQAKTGEPYDIDNLPEKPMSLIWIPASLAGGGLVGLVGTGSMKRKLKSVSKERVASNYLVNKRMSPFSNDDLYLYSVVTKTERSKDSDSSSAIGGAIRRVSSSGRSHGGSSGKF